MKMTDYELVKAILPVMLEPYRSAKEFCSQLPDYALVKLRSAVELLCDDLLHADQVPAEGLDLYLKIDALRGRWPKEFVSTLHHLRITGNRAAHASAGKNADDQPVTAADAGDALEKYRFLLETVYLCRTDIDELNTEVVQDSSQALKQHLVDALQFNNIESAYIAGRICLANREQFIDQAEAQGDHAAAGSDHARYLLKLAIAYLDVAKSEIIDARYHLAIYLAGKWDGEERVEEGRSLMLEMAEQRYVPACVYAGVQGLCWPEWKDDQRTERFLHFALDQGDSAGGRWLFRYYRDHVKNGDAAVTCLKRSIELGNADAEAELAMLYSHGEFVEKDWDEACRWIDSAAEKGSRIGIMQKDYYRLLRQQDERRQVERQVRFIEARASDSGKIGRNARCPCGSGKKFKKCCG